MWSFNIKKKYYSNIVNKPLSRVLKIKVFQAIMKGREEIRENKNVSITNSLEMAQPSRL